MIINITKTFKAILLCALSFPVFASDSIKITVKTAEKNAVAIGFTVDKQDYGALGKSYTGTGPRNKEYFFGYKKDSIFGENIFCGTLILDQNATVILIHQNDGCKTVLA